MHDGHQVGGTQQQHKNQDEARPGRKRRLSGELFAGLDIHVKACIQMPRLLGMHGKRGGQRKRYDGAHDHGKLGTHEHGNDQGRADKGHTGKQRHAGNAVQTLAYARNVALIIGDTARDQYNEQRHHHKERCELHQLNGRQMQRVQAHQVGNGHRGDADGAVGRGHAVSQ